MHPSPAPLHIAYSRMLRRIQQLCTLHQRLPNLTLTLSRQTLLSLHCETLKALEYPTDMFEDAKQDLIAFLDSEDLAPFQVADTHGNVAYRTVPLYADVGVDRLLLQGTSLDWLNTFDYLQAVESFKAYQESFEQLPLPAQQSMVLNMLNAMRTLEIIVRDYVLPRLNHLASGGYSQTPEITAFAKEALPLATKLAHLVRLPTSLASKERTIDHATNAHLLSMLNPTLLQELQTI